MCTVTAQASREVNVLSSRCIVMRHHPCQDKQVIGMTGQRWGISQARSLERLLHTIIDLQFYVDVLIMFSYQGDRAL